eukprot:CAMPEP_0172166916 /NCGR_PEP_ID=MMETSP1050-20130122/9272_1 /TAXON_ID=233186 /ORGANISM="Cryptomonas curvata, Strain CCAP979/52" /LENGTH=204 /DNA_ID=CAMNT_0012837629 /DNA_START=193 /DNA_END=803 /DNA_ORIENTATION=-
MTFDEFSATFKDPKLVRSLRNIGKATDTKEGPVSDEDISFLWDLGDEDHNGTLSRTEFFKVARKFEYFEKERESLKIIIRKMKKSPTDDLQDDDLRKLLSTVTGRIVGSHDVEAVTRHYRRLKSRDVGLGHPPDAAEEELHLIKSISIWNWNVQHRVKDTSAAESFSADEENPFLHTVLGGWRGFLNGALFPILGCQPRQIDPR